MVAAEYVLDIEDVIDLGTIIAVGDHRTFGESDAIEWQKLIGYYTRDECVDAIQAHRRDYPGVWLEPGHIVARVKAARRDALDRMDPDERAQIVGGETSRDDQGYVNKTALGGAFSKADVKNAIRQLAGQPAEGVSPGSASEAARVATVRGRHVRSDPAGWSYEHDCETEEEHESRRDELEARIDAWLEKHPGVTSRGAAEIAIRTADRRRAIEFFVRNGRKELAVTRFGASVAECGVTDDAGGDIVDGQVAP